MRSNLEKAWSCGLALVAFRAGSERLFRQEKADYINYKICEQDVYFASALPGTKMLLLGWKDGKSSGHLDDNSVMDVDV